MLLVIGSVTAQSGQLDQALALSQEHVARSRLENGCIAHAVHLDSENPQRLVFVEQWASKEALWTHFMLPASRGFGKALAGLAAIPPEMRVYDASLVPIPGKTPDPP